ncbi:MAG: hypothetical protein KKB50_15715 [Planctomycetes bacterium]|nr:hypothetical protein [Planctomycetota bacterium]
MRNYDRNQKRRAVCRSGDGGQTWSGFRHDPALSEPICQASLIRYQPADAPGEPIVLFSNPASESKRVGLTVRLSYNDGGDWSVAKELHTGPAAYSCLATLPDGDVACLYEAGETEPYEKIRLTRFTLDWLTDRAHRLPSTVRPVPRSAQWWQQRHEQVNARARQGGVDLVFLGDSITQGWETAGKTVWEKYYGPRNAVNIGFSGDRTQHVLWRLDHGNVADLTPKTVVVMIGTNNSNGQDNTAAEIAAGITAIVEKLRAKLPQTKVLLLGVFPRGAQPNAQREKNATASHLAAQCADGEMIHYLDIGEAFLEPDKSLSREIMPDLLHLSPRGYEIWAEAIEEKLAELLGD